MFTEKTTALYVKGTLLLDSLKKKQKGLAATEYTVMLAVITAAVITIFSSDATDSLMGALKAKINGVATQVGELGTKK